ncbi:uncharacterized protein METZ01_LOCUS169838, partial [marine metagenome]
MRLILNEITSIVILETYKKLFCR